MKVLCIDAKTISICPRCGNNLSDFIKEGVQYEVYQSPTNPNSYKVFGYEKHTCGQNISYIKSRFIPCSDIDEREFVREEDKISTY